MPSQPAQGVPSPVVVRVLLLQNHPETGQSLVEISPGGSQQVESARGGAGYPVRAGGDSQGNLFPDVLDLTTPLLLRFSCFLMFSTAERRLSNKKSEDWRARPSSCFPFGTSPFLPWLGPSRDTAAEGTAFVLPSGCTPGQAALLAPLWGDPRELLLGNPRAPGGTQWAEGAVGSSQPCPTVGSGPAPLGTLAAGGTVWGPGDLPWFLQLLLTHFCSVCSLLPQRVPSPQPPRPPGMLLQVPAGPVFFIFLGGWDKQLLGLQHPPATWKPRFPWKPFLPQLFYHCHSL